MRSNGANVNQLNPKRDCKYILDLLHYIGIRIAKRF